MMVESNDVGNINQSVGSPLNEPFTNKPSGNKLLYLLASPSRYIQRKFKAGGLWGSIFTIMASTVGAGILSLPYAFNLSGLYQGILIFTLGMVVSLYTCQLLVIAAEKTGKLTYESIGNELYGPKMRTFCEVNMIINNFGTVIGYIVLLKDLVPNCLNLFGVTNSALLSPYLWGCTITIAIVYPLSLKQEISALRYTSFLSTCACIYLAIAIMIAFFDRTNDPSKAFKNAPAFEPSAYDFLTASSYVVFAFTCHPNVIPIYQELQRRSTKRGLMFLSRGICIVLILYLVVGIFGFVTFYDDYHPLTDFPQQILQAKYSKGNVPIIIVSSI